MTQVSSSQLAAELGVSAGRISQYVAEGKLDGCYSGERRARRFDLSKVKAALGRSLDPGQMMGNGAATKRQIDALPAERELPFTPRATPQKADSELNPRDPDRYELARIISAEEKARRDRRDNLADEGTFVLASEVSRQVQRAVGQEVREFESVLRDGARRVADKLGVDFLVARKLLTDVWREHRAVREKVLAEGADQAAMTEAETEQDV